MIRIGLSRLRLTSGGAGFDIGAHEFADSDGVDGGEDVLDAFVDQAAPRDTANAPDARTSMDASRDASALVDSGTEAGTPTTSPSNCGCAVPGRKPAQPGERMMVVDTLGAALSSLRRRRVCR